jgi:endonuclease/exonuclease/phosphatase family metal-dependent hydrolase
MNLTVLQWNCMYSESPEKIAAFVKELSPDIVCLQELTNGYHAQDDNTGAYIMQALQYEGYFSYGAMVLPDGVSTQMGMGIFSKHAILDTKKVILQHGQIEDGKVVQDERFYLQATIRIGGTRLTIGSTHLPFHPKFRTTKHKQAMVEAIEQYIPADTAYILACDLNTTPGTNAATSLRRSGLKNAGPALSLPTWTTKPFSIGPWSYERLQWRLDYILFSGPLKKISAETLTTELSDHLPLFAKFKLVI